MRWGFFCASFILDWIMQTVREYLINQAYSEEEKKAILVLLNHDYELWFDESLIPTRDQRIIDELWQWFILFTNEQRTSYMTSIRQKKEQTKQNIMIIEQKLKKQMIIFDEVVDTASEDDVESLLDQLK